MLLLAPATIDEDDENITEDIDYEQEDNSERPLKRKKSGGRPPRGEDFWSKFLTWVQSKEKDWGSDMQESEGWQT